MSEIIDGNATAKAIHEELKAELAQLKFDRPPCVAFIRVGEDPASVSYVKKKGRVAGEIGIESRLHVLPESTSQDELNALIDTLNADDNVDAVLIQAPLPKQLNERDTFNRVRADKDVDGFSNDNDAQSGWRWPEDSAEVAEAADADSHIDDDAIDSNRLPEVPDSQDDLGGDAMGDDATDEEDSAYDAPSFLRRRFHRKKDK